MYREERRVQEVKEGQVTSLSTLFKHHEGIRITFCGSLLNATRYLLLSTSSRTRTNSPSYFCAPLICIKAPTSISKAIICNIFETLECNFEFVMNEKAHVLKDEMNFTICEKKDPHIFDFGAYMTVLIFFCLNLALF